MLLKGRDTVLFIDRDWAGKEGQASYPITMNPNIRHQDAVPHQYIFQVNDNYMLDIMF